MTVSMKTRRFLKVRASQCCERCGRWGATNAHHRLNRSQGGTDSLSNLGLLCGSGTTGCHGWVTEHPTEAGVEGWAIPRGEQRPPCEVEVWRFDIVEERRLWVLLDDAGGFERVPAPTQETA